MKQINAHKQINHKPKKFMTLLDAVNYWASCKPNAIAFEMSEHAKTEALTFLDLKNSAEIIAQFLIKEGSPGDRVMLPTDNSLSFVTAFLGCLYAGMIAVPIQMPRIKSALPDFGLGKFKKIIIDCNASIALFDVKNMLFCERKEAQLITEKTHCYCIQKITQAEKTHQPLPGISKNDLAFLQYTSGSTSLPKGVMLTHHALMKNQHYVQKNYELSEDSTLISWLPLYHDMGLCVGFTSGIYLGAKTILMKPLKFVANPISWLKEITRHKNVVSGAPNFAFQHCLKRIKDEELPGIDLSQWKTAFCGAEPIHPATIFEFIKRFSVHGFKSSAFCASYGLAESTLFVTASRPGHAPVVTWFDKNQLGQRRAIESASKSPDYAIPLMSCGKKIEGISIVITDLATGQTLPEAHIGEICVSSESTGKGYWNRETESSETFNVSIDGYKDKKFLKTGDLGFILNEEIYVSGREKELIIVNGVNYFPHDIEYAAQHSDELLSHHKAAAYEVEINQTNQLILTIELPKNAALDNLVSLSENVRKVIRAEFDLILGDVQFVKSGTIPTTSSGKVQRTLCAKTYKKKADFLEDKALEKFSIAEA